MAAEKAEILLIGAAKPVIVGGLEPSFDRSQADRGQGPGCLPEGCRAAHPRYRDRLYLQQDRRRLHVALSEARNRVELRRRLRPCRRQMGRRARHRRDQHAGRAERGSRRYRARPAALHACANFRRPIVICAPANGSRRRLSAHAGDVARPHRRHRRHGPHRQGDRAPARCLRRAGGLSLAQSAGRRRPTSIIRS